MAKISKISDLMSNLFNKSPRTDNIRTDAAAVTNFSTQNESVQSEHLNSRNTENNAGPILNYSNDHESPSGLAQSNITYSLHPTTESDRNVMPFNPYNSAMANATQNNLAVNQTQGHNVFQFSQVNGLHIGSVYNIQSSKNSQNQNITDGCSDKLLKKSTGDGASIKKTKTIDAMLRCTDPIEQKEIDLIATNLGEGWRFIIRQLGFSDGQMEQMIEENYVKGIKETIYQFLLEWSRNDEDPSLGRICRLLWKNGHKETVYILKEHWKSVHINSGDNIFKQTKTID